MIKKNQFLKFENLITKRAKGRKEFVEKKLNEFYNEIMSNPNIERNGPIISVAYSVEIVNGEHILDSKMLIPIKGKYEDKEKKYILLPYLTFDNAVTMRYMGDVKDIEAAYMKLTTFVSKYKVSQNSSLYHIYYNEQPLFKGETTQTLVDLVMNIEKGE